MNLRTVLKQEAEQHLKAIPSFLRYNKTKVVHNHHNTRQRRKIPPRRNNHCEQTDIILQRAL